jgi:type IV pilus assembly protein PilM
MKWGSLNGGSVYLEFRPRSLRVLHETQTLAIPLERQATGRLTNECREKVALGLSGLLRRKSWQPRIKAVCAIDARGVSLRRLSLPASANEDVQKVLRLQIEREFPLSPDALAWGFTRLDPHSTSANGSHEVVLAALKKELIEDYAQVLNAAGINPVFTLAAFERSRICPKHGNTFAQLDVGRRQSELISFKDGAPEWIRILPWGGEDITKAIEQALGVTQDEAEILKLKWDEGPVPNGEVGQKVHAAIVKSLESLAKGINAVWSGERLFLTGRGARYKEMPNRLKDLLPKAIECQRIETQRNDGPTAAILGLKQAAENGSGVAPLVLRLKEARPVDAPTQPGESPAQILAWLGAQAREIVGDPDLRKWVRLALILGLCAVCFPLVEAFALRWAVAKRIAEYNAQTNRLDTIDREFSFLLHLKKTQPPYLDALTVIANSAAPGTRFDSISMNSRGELSMNGNVQNAQQVVDFRSKLIKSGFFSTVTVEEEAPSPNPQRMKVRIAALCKPAGSRPPVKAEALPAGFASQSGPMPFPGMMMEGGPPPFMPGGDMPPPMPVIRGGPNGAPTPPPGTRKSPSTRSSSRTVTVGPNGEIIVTGDSKSSDDDAKGSKGSKEKKDSTPEPNN